MITEYILVLIKEIPQYEAEGWRLINNKIHVVLGGWPSVYMVRKIE